jgi:hypothetical protein
MTATPVSSGSWLTRTGEPEERAQILARVAIELAARFGADGMTDAAFELMRGADHDTAMLEHALVVCRSLARHDPVNKDVKLAIRLLKAATMFLGVPPPLFETRSPRRAATTLRSAP